MNISITLILAATFIATSGVTLARGAPASNSNVTLTKLVSPVSLSGRAAWTDYYVSDYPVSTFFFNAQIHSRN